MKKYSCLITALIIILSLQCQALAAARIPVYRANGALFFFDKKTGTITGFAGEPKDLIIPGTLGGYKVLSIGEKAFNGCKTLNTLSIPEGVTTVNNGAFGACVNLKSVEIPASVNYIGDSAFAGCSMLSNVYFKGLLENIAPNAFYGTPWITSSTIEFLSLGGTSLIKYNGNAEVVYVPQGIKYIEPGAFAYNSTVKEIVLPEGVVKIGANAFVHCYSLEKIYIPSTVAFIGTGAFDDTKWIKSQSGDFICVNGMLVSYSGGEPHVSIPEGIKGICGGAFLSNEYVKSVHIPDGVIYIDEMAFASCKNLISVNIPYTVELIDDFAFSGDSRLTLYGGEGSYAQSYAWKNGINFSTEVYVSHNGEKIMFEDAPPVIYYERTYIPVRAVLEKLGYIVEWNGENRTISAKNGEKEIIIYTDGVITVNSRQLPTVAEPIFINGCALVSVRIIAEGLDAEVNWDDNSRTVDILD